MKRASAIVTNRGGRTCHAAIIARELGIPAVVGCGDATEALKDGALVTVALRRGRHRLRLRRPARDRDHRGAARRAAVLPVKIMMNVGNPQLAFDFAQMPNAGVGLARLEFIINNNIGVHPKAILDYPEHRRRPEEGGRERRPRPRLAARLLRRQAGRRHRDDRRRVLAEAGDRAPLGLQEQRVPQADRRLALRARGRKPDARLPRRLALRQPRRSARRSRWNARRCVRVRRDMGLTNVEVMVPFVRTLGQAERVVAMLAEHGLKRAAAGGSDGLKVIMMCEVPSNAILAERVPRAFRRHVDRLERPDPAHARPRPRLRPRAAGARTSTSATRRSRR